MKRAFILICVLYLIIAAFAGCISKDTESPDEPGVSEENEIVIEIPESEDSDSEIQGDNEIVYEWPEATYGETRDFLLNNGGVEETITMTYTEFDFSHFKAPKICIYMDRERYKSHYFEGEPRIVPIGSGADPVCLMHICPHNGRTVEDGIAHSKEVNERWGIEIIDEGTVELDNHIAYYISTSDDICYYIDYDNGYATLSFYVEPEAQDEHSQRLFLMAKTIEIFDH